ncbi:SatD family protein [uncultured Polaribacter sp.]|uniref:SatD family protein n=1 Tax=uncultured Polaribacter sp. TaxID=174711 RepID=UPI0026244B0E|nr:SatD family protein [uncultured Polaribacter sp.]
MTSIITGDIINSRNVDTNIWMSLLKKTFQEIGASPKTWEIFRGDSFQVEIEQPEHALFFTIKLKAILKQIKNLDVRIGIGIGEKTENYKRITEGNGEAFTFSGKAFDTLVKKQNLAVLTNDEKFNTLMNTSLALALLIMDNWTKNSAEFTVKYLNNKGTTQKILAKELNISESSASERRKRAGLDEIMQFEKIYRTMVTHKKINGCYSL